MDNTLNPAHEDHVLNCGHLDGYTFHDLGNGIRFNTRTTRNGELIVGGNDWRLSMRDRRFRHVSGGPETYGHITTYWIA